MDLKIGAALTYLGDNTEYFTHGHVYTVCMTGACGVYVTDNTSDAHYLTYEYMNQSFYVEPYFAVDKHFNVEPPPEQAPVCKDTNPKDAVGIKKPPMSTVSAPVMLEIGTAMLEGARKYGRHNYRVANVRASVYYDAALRHLFSWFEGEDTDPDSGMSHITKALASLTVLRDAQINGCIVDDRPPRSKYGWKDDIQQQVNGVFDRYPEAKEAYTHE